MLGICAARVGLAASQIAITNPPISDPSIFIFEIHGSVLLPYTKSLNIMQPAIHGKFGAVLLLAKKHFQLT